MTTGYAGPVGDQLISIYERLLAAFGPQDWWPGDSPFEVCAGAILTQNTSWENVKRAISNLKNKGLLSPMAIYELPRESLARIIRPAGYYNVKASRLQNFVAFLLGEFEGNLDNMFSMGLETLRPMLLDIKGIGPETADSILLYAGELPSFVVDVYTVRALMRHGFIDENADYEGVRSLFMDHLPADVELYNEYHALWVILGKSFCKKTKPRCEECPLNGI
ncbi:MAG: endonuclease III domain-containing protein [Deltaproteobacteria bacterium]|nr:endonuclease III domain-containing protein [Deltaproteobacteria bacterium]